VCVNRPKIEGIGITSLALIGISHLFLFVLFHLFKCYISGLKICHLTPVGVSLSWAVSQLHPSSRVLIFSNKIRILFTKSETMPKNTIKIDKSTLVDILCTVRMPPSVFLVK